MRRSMPLFALGVVFAVTGAVIIALTLRKSKPSVAHPNKSQLREQAASRNEANQLRLAGGIIAGLGMALILIS